MPLKTLRRLKSNCETCQSDSHRHFPHPAETEKKLCTGVYVCRFRSGCDQTDKAFVLGEKVTTLHSVYIADLNWGGDSHVSPCRSFFNFSVKVFFLLQFLLASSFFKFSVKVFSFNFSLQVHFSISPWKYFFNFSVEVFFQILCAGLFSISLCRSFFNFSLPVFNQFLRTIKFSPCRSFFKTVDKQRSESMSAVPRWVA